jgi:translation initiation factor IF-3
VCRLLDYGRYKFETIKREKDQRRRQNVIKLKEMKLRPKVADHDFMTKFKGMRQFLEQGEKVKVTIMFRGREMVHQDIGRRLLDRVADAAKDVAVIERQPIMEGRNLFMILAPLHKPQPKPEIKPETKPQQAAPVPAAAAAAAPQRKEASQSA